MYESYDESVLVTKLVKVESHVRYVHIFNKLQQQSSISDRVIWVGVPCLSTVGYYWAFANLVV
jgi:hypothetical protein